MLVKRQPRTGGRVVVFVRPEADEKAEWQRAARLQEVSLSRFVTECVSAEAREVLADWPAWVIDLMLEEENDDGCLDLI